LLVAPFVITWVVAKDTNRDEDNDHDKNKEKDTISGGLANGEVEIG